MVDLDKQGQDAVSSSVPAVDKITCSLTFISASGHYACSDGGLTIHNGCGVGIEDDLSHVLFINSICIAFK